MSKIGRNERCPCGSGLKTKKCCGPGTAGVAAVPTSSEQFNEWGNALADQGRLAEAVLYYERALEVNPHLAGAHSNLRITCKDMGQITKCSISIPPI